MKLKGLLLLLISTMAGIANAQIASAEVPEGVWLIKGEAAVQIFDLQRSCVAGFFGCRPRMIPMDSLSATRGTPIQRCGSANCAG